MQRWSKLFIPTLRDVPADAEVASHQILLRAGYIRQLGAGIYSYLPLATRAINKINRIVREEMDTIAQEFFLPALNPREIWEESGRWTGMGDNMFRLKDRKGADLCLGMTHEEIMTSIARGELRSYKQLPQIWYQIQTKFRDEPRPKSGLLRVRQFTMKDSYSFDIDDAGLDESYNKHDAAYRRIFTRCGLEFVAVEADSGAMGGSQSQEFMVYTDAGEDWIASSPDGKYAANIEKATSTLAPVTDLEASGDGTPELVHTPGQRTIDEVGAFLGVEKHAQIKTMALIATWPADAKGFVKTRAVVAFLRGDHQLNEAKLGSLVGGAELRPMVPEEIEATFNAPAGYLGPIGVAAAKPGEDKGTLVVLDASLEGRKNLIAGANKEEYHLRNVTPGRDFAPTAIADIRNINEGEPDPIGGQPLRLGKAVEIGHIFKLGYKYSQSMGARVLDKNGKEVTPIMGSYGIGIERILTSAIEQSAAKNGKNDRGEYSYALPPSIAPFEVVVTVTKQSDVTLAAAGEQIALDLEKAGFDVLLDDRNDSAGSKFKDADLIGVPYRVTIGKGLAEGTLEVVDRLAGKTENIAVADVVNAMIKLRQQTVGTVGASNAK
ncbi:prolyl-tRNA synthetase [Terriglobus roseus DSM 18391]|uniref:Proline--tRNA ligase n=1 Tax=Terriglobus roseus (strain DSM 18391 / NRRL B-41598 / KBS 63) TaxID=926566 RepID=I3ZCW1_TERRK|nr:proline--tRNA ligase [Terriglobus roseus]AFL87079.1 prolyl-tRNA synthetase [Terriglobus roseus DSM 18391]